MTHSHDDADFAETDAYIIRQLHEATARLGASTDTKARLQEVLRAVGDDINTQRRDVRQR
jgi:hypothetical protein